jgi:hypothetical protein
MMTGSGVRAVVSSVVARNTAPGPDLDRAALNYLRYFWDGVYAITDGGNSSFTARPCFGGKDVLRARTAQQLGSVIRDHYGRPVFRCST